VALCGAEDLLLETAIAAVRAEHALGGLLHAVGRAGREPVLGEPHTLLLELLGLSGGEVDLDGGGAPVGDLLTEFVAVLARGQEQRHLLAGDGGAQDPDLVLVAGRRAGRSCLGGRCEAGAADEERAGSEDRSRSSSHEPPWGWSATASNACQAHDTRRSSQERRFDTHSRRRSLDRAMAPAV